MLRNTTQSFGSLSKFLHWLIAILIGLQFYLVWGQSFIVKNSPTKIQYTLLHKSFGLVILILSLFFIFWRTINVKPSYPASQPRWKQTAAKAVHHTLLSLLLLMPVLGYLMSCASGRTVYFFNFFALPSLISADKDLSNLLFQAHEKLGYLLFMLICLHVGAALHHHFILKDNVLKRML